MRVMGLLAIFCLMFGSAAAQSDTPVVTPVTGSVIGLDCPEAQTIDPAGEVLWVLMSGCFTGEDFRLTTIDVQTGAVIEADYRPEGLSVLDEQPGLYFSMGFTPEGALHIGYFLSDTYLPVLITIPFESGVTEAVISDEALATLISGYTTYPEITVYDKSHRLAAIVDLETLHVLDLTTQSELFTLPVEYDSYNAYASFSVDGQRLYIGVLDDFEDYENYNSSLLVYSVPEGELLATYTDILSPFLTVSPDEKYAAVTLMANDSTWSHLYIVDLESAAASAPVMLFEPPHRATACTNDGRSLTDLDLTVDGRLYLAGLDWLPDSSGLAYARDYGGDGLGGGRPCSLNTSRFDYLTVE